MDFRDLDKLIDGLDEAVEQALDQAAAHAADVARKAAGSGPVAKTIRVRKRGAFEREIVTDDPGAFFLDQGRGPAVAHGKAMHFVVAGKDVFVKHVAAAPPHPFLAPAAAELEATAGELVEQAIGRLVT